MTCLAVGTEMTMNLKLKTNRAKNNVLRCRVNRKITRLSVVGGGQVFFLLIRNAVGNVRTHVEQTG